MNTNDDNATERYRQLAQEAHDDAMMYKGKLEAAEARIAQLEADCAAHKAAEETQIALRQKAEEREAALRAYIQRLSSAVQACMANDERKFVFTPDDYRELEGALESSYSGALARRDKIKQAEALVNETVRKDYTRFAVNKLLDSADELRQQAEQC